MCGICGWVNFDSQKFVEESVVKKMTATLAHRGPDGEGLYLDSNFAMGHRRLSIIDLQAGKQPLANEDKTVWVSFNGEIYNFVELMDDLEKRGHKFKTRSDTEVLVHLYEEKQEEMLHDLRGMFAFSIWDKKKRKLFIARDRIGKKPLYYYYLPGHHFIYGSELKAVLASGRYEKEVDYHALDHYLSYLYVPTPQTIFKGINKLEAGHYLTVEGGNVNLKEYWDLQYPSPDVQIKSDNEYIEQFREVLKDAVRIRLRSDVPLGAFLSGGIDSSAVVSIMSEINPGMVETVSVGFQEEEYNELDSAQFIANLYGCRYNEFFVKEDCASILSTLLGYFDEPFADSSMVPTYYVSKAAREKVIVALSGDGGDESMAGYARHSIELLEHRLRRISKYYPAHLLKSVYKALPRGTKGRNIIGNLSRSIPEAAARKHNNLLFNDELKQFIYKDESLITDCSSWMRKLYEQGGANNVLDRMLYLDMKSYLHDDILVKVDRMSMAVGLEVRAPLLDHKVLEFLSTVPPHLKIRNGRSKYLLKKMLEPNIPSSILNRKKQGFELPIGIWLRGKMRSLIEDVFTDSAFRNRGIYNNANVLKMWQTFLEGKQDYAHQIWQILILEIWYRQYIDCNS